MSTVIEGKEKTKKHPNYVAVFFALAILTAIEVATTQLTLPVSRAVILVPLSVIKALLVALFYMHLRTDRRIFSFLFSLGFVLGIAMLISFTLLINSPFGHTH